MQKSVIGKKVADFALVTYVGHLFIDSDQSQELIELLDEKYKVKNQKGIELILERIKDGLYAKQTNEEKNMIQTQQKNRNGV